MLDAVTKILNRLQEKPIHRTMTFDRAAVNADKRTVEVAFASNKPIEHWFGMLELSVDRKSMRTDRLDSGAPLLCEHDPRDVVGVVEDYSLRNGVARAVVRFGESARAQEVFQDVKTGIRTNISVGFMIRNLEIISNKKDEIPVYRSDDWEPFEVSIVSIPADISVGVGRSKNLWENKTNMNNENENLTVAEEIRELGKVLKMENVASQYLRDGVLAESGTDITIDGFKAFARSQQPPTIRVPVEDPVDYVYRQGGGHYVELARSVPRYGKLRSFSGPGAEMRAHRMGQWILGGPLGNRAAAQWCQQNGLMMSRAQTEGLNEKGGFLVPEEFGNDLIDLVERYGVFRQFAKIIPMSSDTRTDPVVDGELDSQFVGEMEEGDDQDLDFGLISLTARKHMVLVPLSSEVTEDAAISIADILMEQAARAFAKKEDLCGFNGDATSTYGGITGVCEKLKGLDVTIANIAGLQVGTGNAYNELTLGDFEGVVARLPQYADGPNTRWFVSRSFYWNTMVPIALTGGTVLMHHTATASQIEGRRSQTFLGYPVEFVQVMPKTEANSQVCALFGDLALGARLGDRRRVTIAIDDSILFRKDALLLRATSRFDINVHGVGNASATAADRVAGPIVGLITAAA